MKKVRLLKKEFVDGLKQNEEVIEVDETTAYRLRHSESPDVFYQLLDKGEVTNQDEETKKPNSSQWIGKGNMAFLSCEHEFVIDQITTEGTDQNHQVAYVVCPKCGLVKKQDI